MKARNVLATPTSFFNAEELTKMKTFGELTQIELDETIAKNEYESRLIRAIRARTTGADPQALIKDLIPPDELARMIEEAKESLK
jgi:hypothetical protein